jgi:hypothetical protein
MSIEPRTKRHEVSSRDFGVSVRLSSRRILNRTPVEANSYVIIN